MQRSEEHAGQCVLLHVAKYDKINHISSFSLTIQENKVSLIRVFVLIFVSQQEEVKKMKPRNTNGEYKFAFA